MDALRKAERQKQQNAAHEPPQGNAVPDKPDPEPLSTQAGASQLPELPQRLEILDDQFFTNEPLSTRPTRPSVGTRSREHGSAASPRKGADTTSRDAVRNVFATKQAAVKGAPDFAIVVGLSTLVAAAASAGYLYWQMQPAGGLSAGPALAQVAPAVNLPPPGQPSPLAAPQSLPPATPTESTTALSGKAAGRARTEPLADSIAAHPEQRTAAPSHPIARNVPIRVSSSARQPHPDLEKAHQAFNRGEFAPAKSAWLGVLQSDPRNADALHGLAAIAQQEGQAEQAADYYLRALAVDPKDALAVSGLAALKGSTDTRQTESRLKTLLAELPDSPYLNFALGNLYAQDARWAEAQQTYFKAHTADPGNPDYLYNLAVSLDHLHQPRHAARYYERAIEAARQQVAGFDAVQAAVRLNTLQSGLPP